MVDTITLHEEEPAAPAPSTQPRRRGLLAGGAGLLMVACLVLPAALGAAGGSLIGGELGIVVAVVVALGVVGLMRLRRRTRGVAGC